MATPLATPMSSGDSVPLVERLLAPFRQFAHTASSGGVVLLAATAVALAWANSPWAASYHHLWETPITLGAGGWAARTTLHHLINDGLMAVFFFLVGLEIKREVLAGELASVRRAALPMVGALGGMVVPAALYALVNAGGPGAPGWGVPMATDIAFALGVLALLGDRVPVGLKVFLAALAIVDDIGAVLVIAVFYSGGVAWGALGTAAALVALAALANLAGVRRPGAYAAVGVALWAAVLLSGVHATVAGVLLAMTIPVRTRIAEGTFLREAERVLHDFDAAAQCSSADPRATVLGNAGHHTALEELERLSDAAQPPLIRMEHALHGVVAFAIMPLFALANAGVTLGGDALRAAAAHPVTLGALLGLLVGKPVGIVGFSWAAVRLGWASLPHGVTWRSLAGAGVLGGIGFTMALFIAGLAFPGADGAAGGASPLLDAAKVGVLAASTVAGVAGWLLLRAGPRGQSAVEARRDLDALVAGAAPAADHRTTEAG
ncbi:Na+/H+ antiporter NhaA [Roseisolibacter sp. H3M3-2]|uniref:Na+/H+ antiporter NhaA n=1 Tax=Roseisolibacter sp. H3M3-2 TaxID=3031323 RepID=UPI0023DBBFC4|nr:Na+/H+ antiporter NhaA [Roseisolibacter sp. H3M3-2]MDF1505692.1 Na+/H+ antiporter NhaA [Roseisolibacter sp. H3M3-2]